MQTLMNTIFKQTTLLAAICFSLSGCVVGAAVDLAATTVFTAGKIAVKTTGAVVDAVIPDKDDDDKKSKKKKQQQEPQQNAAYPQYQPADNTVQPSQTYPQYQPADNAYQPNASYPQYPQNQDYEY